MGLDNDPVCVCVCVPVCVHVCESARVMQARSVWDSIMILSVCMCVCVCVCVSLLG